MANPQIKTALVQLLKEGQKAIVPASGISMYPLLQPNDKLLVKPSIPKVGDIAVFDRGDVLVAHRVYKITNDYYYCKGDSLVMADNPVKKENILGIVIERTRKTKTISINNIRFKILQFIMPKATFLLGRPFFYFALLHQKIIVKDK